VFPVWSPDGSKIAYSRNYLSGGIPQADIYICNTDGSNEVKLTSASGRDENPCWSPDGNQILFQSERDGNFEIYKMNSDGTNQERLTNEPAWDGWGSWSKKGTNSVGWEVKLPKYSNFFKTSPIHLIHQQKSDTVFRKIHPYLLKFMMFLAEK
jgi:tricorn protease-like protein